MANAALCADGWSSILPTVIRGGVNHALEVVGMPRRKLILFATILATAGCEIPPVDETYISKTPASSKSFAVAERAVKACSDLADREKVQRNFQRAGFGVSVQHVIAKTGRQIPRMIISPPDEAVSVLYFGSSCYVGLEGMTPDQSKQLAQIWVDAHGAQPNSAYGDGLSDHVSGAWRRFVSEPHRIPDKAAYSHRIFIGAHKTWPHGPYDPQRDVGFAIPEFPKVPGAAVHLNHVVECRPHVKTGPRSGVFLPCSGPEYRPD